MAMATRTVRPAQASILADALHQKATIERHVQSLLAVLIAGEEPGGFLQSVDPQTGLLTFEIPDQLDS